MEKQLFSIGLPISLDLGGYFERIFTSLIGWETNLLFITKLPYIDRKPVSIFSGSICVVRFFKDGAAYGFEAEAISVQHYPVPLIFFKYPVDINEITVRKHKRVNTNIPARIHYADNLAADATVVNLSEGGCLLKTSFRKENTGVQDKQLKVNKRCELTLNVMDKILENIPYTVRSIQIKDGVLLFGIEFITFPPAHKEVITSFLNVINSTTT
jgi:c-di-GMP-binding flagellar brake protein YcgR